MSDIVAPDRALSPPNDFGRELRQLLEDARYGVLAMDQEGRIFFANRRLEAMSGYSLADLIDRPFEVLVPSRARGAHRSRRVEYQATGASRPIGTDLDIRFRRQDGSEFSADVTLAPVDTPTDERIVIAAVRDLSDR